MQSNVIKTASPIEILRRPGVYTAREGTPAYTAISALLLTRRVAMLGERFLANGDRVVTVRSGRGTEARSNPSIELDSEFFVGELRTYASWPEKWWREAVQNAVDAGATEIHCGHMIDATGNHVVTFRDNGRGMTEEILTTKFIKPGATTKRGEAGAAGGFGRAKMLLLFPWISWQVHTRTHLAKGEGSHYEVTSAQELRGTEITVVMPNEYRQFTKMYTTQVEAISFIKKCYLPHVTFYVNGERVRADLKVKDELRTIGDKAVIYSAKADSELRTYMVRHNGLFMFDQYLDGTGSPVNIIVELTQASTRLLQANRDGFEDYDMRRAMSEFTSEIAKDTMSAVRSKKGMIRQKFLGDGKFSTAEAVKRNEELANDRAAHMIMKVGAVEHDKSVGRRTVEEMLAALGKFQAEDSAPDDTIGVVEPQAAAAMLDHGMRGAQIVEATSKLLVWKPDFYLINDIDGFKIPKKFFPGTMTPSVLKLAKAWTELCRFVLIQLGCARQFGVGFHFDTNTRASFLPDGEERWLLLNPFRSVYARNAIYSTAQDDDLKWLYAAAIHECTHMAGEIKHHDEAFAAALTVNMAKCADGFRKIKRIVASLRTRGSKE
jgi:hypothetical protein